MIREYSEQDGAQRTAWYSEDMAYRYNLTILWADGPILTTIGLNPSTATAFADDPTIRRGIGFAKSLGCSGYRMLNAFALRSTDPKVLFASKDPVGSENTYDYLKRQSTETTVACWGAAIQSRSWKHVYRGHNIADALPNLVCFQKTKNGHPAHPLYLKADLKPIPFSYGESK